MPGRGDAAAAESAGPDLDPDLDALLLSCERMNRAGAGGIWMRLEKRWLEAYFRDALGVPLVIAVAHAPADERDLSPAEREAHAALRGSRRLDSWLRGRAALKCLLSELEAGAGSQPPSAMEPAPDTSFIRPPHPGISLSHSGEHAIAVGLSAGPSGTPQASAIDVTNATVTVPIAKSPGSGRDMQGAESRLEGAHEPAPLGVGVDLEVGRAPRAGSERFFLAPSEIAWLESVDTSRRPEELLRLWTVKEALFKANLANEGTLLAQYALADPATLDGRARWSGDPDAAASAGGPAGHPAPARRRHSFRYATMKLDGGGFLTIAILEALHDR